MLTNAPPCCDCTGILYKDEKISKMKWNKGNTELTDIASVLGEDKTWLKSSG